MKPTRLEAAVKYAHLRWLWDDISMIVEVIERDQGDVFDAIDDHANKYDLADPLDHWQMSIEKTDRHRAAIDQLRKDYTALSPIKET